ncbi:MAG TPA: Mur ligase domain-containing protein, partial [Saprospiraceae bacterium]|nr:Mur ligase domain-containing protein [Saprospiraceae bacterium]
MQLLGRLLENISPFSIRGNTDCRIENICIDSRKVSKSSLFIAIKGTLTDGHKFIESAIRQGAVAVVCESLPDTLVADVCYIVTDNSHKASGLLAAAFYGFPSDSLKVIGI